MGLNPALVTEAHIYARHIRSTKPNAMIGVLFQNDVLGKPFLKGIHEGLGSEHGDMIVKAGPLMRSLILRSTQRSPLFIERELIRS